MGVAVNNTSPQELLFPTTVTGFVTGSVTLFTAKAWVKLLSLVITYVTSALSTPVVTLQIRDAQGNVLWSAPAAAFAASLTNTVEYGGGVSNNIAAPQNQQLAIPNEMFIPPGGTLVAVVSGTGVATDTIQATGVFSY